MTMKGTTGPAAKPETEAPQEQPREEPHPSESKTLRALAETGKTVTEVVEKGVQKVDPLHIFVPNDIPTRLVMMKGLFSDKGGEPYPILECRTLFSYHNLQVIAGNLETISMTIVDSTSGDVVVYCERQGERTDADVTYTIYKTSPIADEDAAKTTDDGRSLYLLATVERASPKDYSVVMANQTSPTYMIEQAGIPANYATNFFIKQVGVKEEVASSHPWEKDTEMVVVTGGIDAALMYCLAAIAEDAKMSPHRKESFSAIMNKVDPRTLVRKKSSGTCQDDKNQQPDDKE